MTKSIFRFFKENNNPGDHKFKNFMASKFFEKKFLALSINSEAATRSVL